MRSVEYTIGANWKLVAENFMEYYHLPWVHPGLVKVSPMSAHHRWQGAGMYTGFCTSPDRAEHGGGRLAGPAGDDGPRRGRRESARFVWVFPYVAVNVAPNHIFLLLTRPLSADATAEIAYLLVPPGVADLPEADGAVEELLAFWDGVNREDIAIVERVQRGPRRIPPIPVGGCATGSRSPYTGSRTW